MLYFVYKADKCVMSLTASGKEEAIQKAIQSERGALVHNIGHAEYMLNFAKSQLEYFDKTPATYTATAQGDYAP